MQAQADRPRFSARLARALWRGLVAVRTPLRWACLVVGLGLVASLLAPPGPQTPAWLETLADNLMALGQATSWWARVGRAGLGFLGALAALRWLSELLPSWHIPSARHAWRRTVLLPWEQAQARAHLADTLALSGLRSSAQGRAGHLVIVGERPWLWHALAVEPGYLVALVALGIFWGVGWRGPQVVCTVDGAHPLVSSPALTAQVSQITALPRPNGTLRGLSDEVSLVGPDAVAEQVAISLGRPARWRNLRLYLVGYGPALRVLATTAAGTQIPLREIEGAGEPVRALRLSFADDQQEKWLAVPERSLLVRLLHYPEGEGQGALSVQIVRGRDGEVLADQFLEGSSVVVADDLTLSVDWELYITLQARCEPQRALAWLGAALLALGALLRWLLPLRSGWALLETTSNGGSRCTLCVPARRRQIAWAECTLNILAERAQAAPGSEEAKR